MSNGHLGSFLVLGIRAGLFIEKFYNKKNYKFILKTINKKPQLCIADGLRAILGLNNVKILNGEEIMIEIYEEENKIAEIFIREEIIDRYVNVKWEECEKAAYEIFSYDDKELFIINEME